MDNGGSSNNGEEQTTAIIIIILIAGVVVFFLVVAWCGFFYGLWRNRQMALYSSRIERRRQKQQQHRRQQLHQQQQQQQQQRNVPQHLYQQRQQQYTPQQLQLQRQQLRQLQNVSRSRLSPQLSPNIPRADFSYQQPQLNSFPPYHGERVSIQSGYITPAADAVPVFIPPRDYDDIDDPNDVTASSTSHHSYHNRTYDYFEGSSSPNQSFTNIGYQPIASYPAGAVEFSQSNVRSGYSPVVPQSTSTPLPKMQAKYKRNSQPTPFENYSGEMQQYQQLQHWPQNY